MHSTCPNPSNEADRVAAVEALNILDTPRAPDFDAVVAIASQIFGCPIALFSVIAADRQWFKAEVGLGICETSLDVSFCSHAIRSTEPMIIEDATRDDRFRYNPLVTSDPSIRFYAGIPINIGEGFKIGALCVIDTVPRHLSLQQVSMLRHLGQIVESLIQGHLQLIQAAEHAQRAASLARTTEDQLRTLTHQTKLLSQSERLAKIGAWEVDLSNGVNRWSDEVYRIHDLAIGTPITLDIAFSFYTPEAREIVASHVAELIAKGTTFECELEIVTAAGRRRWLRSCGDRKLHDGIVVGIFGVVQDVTETHESELLLRAAATSDALTLIPNRFHWNGNLEATIRAADATAAGFAVLIMDLDGFKEINDTRGHHVGDAVLREVARRLKLCLPKDGFCARLGGDEFAILLSGADPAAQSVVESAKLLAELRRPMIIEGVNLHIAGTVGGALFPDDADTASGIMKAADIARYKAKRSRRSSIVMFHKAIAGLFDEKCQAIELVDAALKEDRLVPFYQPQVDLTDGRTVGFEALVRIVASNGTIIGPTHFMPALQDPEAASRIGTRMLHRITADIAGWRSQGLDVGCVALNLAESDFTLCDLPKCISSRLAELGLLPAVLQVEVTENIVLGKDSDIIVRSLRTMHESGIVIALDDFGTGFASLTHLRDLPLDCIKIDRCFVAAIGEVSDSEIIIRSVIDLGHSLGKFIVAEGVETIGQKEFLIMAGCDFVQGFLDGRPASRDDTTSILKERLAYHIRYASPALPKARGIIGTAHCSRLPLVSAVAAATPAVTQPFLKW